MSTIAVSAAPGLDRRRLWFGLDAVVTGVNAVAYLALGGWLADQLGGSATTYRAAGTGLLVFAAAVAAYAAGRERHSAAGWGIVAVNVSWVLGSLAVAAAGLGTFDGLGRTWIALQAVVVTALTVMQARSLRD